MPEPYTCPVRRKSEISPTGERICGATEANIPTEVPMKNTATGAIFPELHYTCLECSIRIASWKLIQNLLIYERANPPRILTPDDQAYVVKKVQTRAAAAEDLRGEAARTT